MKTIFLPPIYFPLAKFKFPHFMPPTSRLPYTPNLVQSLKTCTDHQTLQKYTLLKYQIKSIYKNLLAGQF